MSPLSHQTSAALDAVSSLALHRVPAAIAVTVTIVTEDGALTVGSSSDWAVALDRVQYDPAGGGPCVDAAITGEVRDMTDAASEARWPAYVAASLARGVLSSTSIPIPVDDDGVVGSLNAFATESHAFTAADRDGLTQLAGTAATALTTVDTGDAPRRMRAVVDQAKGIVMNAEGCSAPEALDRMTLLGRDSDRTLREVAADVVLAARQSSP
jgi:GAF domain-containing protein